MSTTNHYRLLIYQHQEALKLELSLHFLPGWDLVPLIITLLACLFMGLGFGILVAVGLNLVYILKQSTRLNMTTELMERSSTRILLVTPYQDLFFASAEFMRSTILKFTHLYEMVDWIVINGQHVPQIDGTMAVELDRLATDLEVDHKRVTFWKWQRDPLGLLYRTNKMLVERFSHADSLDKLIVEPASHVSDIDMD